MICDFCGKENFKPDEHEGCDICHKYACIKCTEEIYITGCSLGHARYCKNCLPGDYKKDCEDCDC